MFRTAFLRCTDGREHRAAQVRDGRLRPQSSNEIALVAVTPFLVGDTPLQERVHQPKVRVRITKVRVSRLQVSVSPPKVSVTALKVCIRGFEVAVSPLKAWVRRLKVSAST
jgi:hypothetical protein